jgi:hypothetical protein
MPNPDNYPRTELTEGHKELLKKLREAFPNLDDEEEECQSMKSGKMASS